MFFIFEKERDGTSAVLESLSKGGSVYLFYQNICQTKPPNGLRFGNLVKLKGNSVSPVLFSFFFLLFSQVYRNILSEEAGSFIGRLHRRTSTYFLFKHDSVVLLFLCHCYLVDTF